MNDMRRLIDLVEAPLEDISLYGDWSDQEEHQKAQAEIGRNAFMSKFDRKTIPDPEFQARLYKLLAKSAPELAVYFSNDPGLGREMANSYLDYGFVDLNDRIRPVQMIPEDLKTMIRRGMAKHPQAIHVLLTHNEGGAIRHNMTPWIAVHRMAHAIFGMQQPKGNQKKAVEHIARLKLFLSDLETCTNVTDILEDIRADETMANGIAGQIMQHFCTMASARNNAILRIEPSDDPHYELFVDMMTQYIIRGKIERKTPTKIVLKHKNGETQTLRVHDQEEFEWAVSRTFDFFETHFDSYLKACRGALMVC